MIVHRRKDAKRQQEKRDACSIREHNATRDTRHATRLVLHVGNGDKGGDGDSNDNPDDGDNFAGDGEGGLDGLLNAGERKVSCLVAVCPYFNHRGCHLSHKCHLLPNLHRKVWW